MHGAFVKWSALRPQLFIGSVSLSARPLSRPVGRRIEGDFDVRVWVSRAPGRSVIMLSISRLCTAGGSDSVLSWPPHNASDSICHERITINFAAGARDVAFLPHSVQSDRKAGTAAKKKTPASGPPMRTHIHSLARLAYLTWRRFQPDLRIAASPSQARPRGSALRSCRSCVRTPEPSGFHQRW